MVGGYIPECLAKVFGGNKKIQFYRIVQLEKKSEPLHVYSFRGSAGRGPQHFAAAGR